MDKLPQAIEQSGYGLAGDIGGIPRQTYFTPDGRVVRAIVAWREYIKKDKTGKVIESGTRDANYDKGWLPIMPKELKPYCQGCGRWHDTQREVDVCIEKRKRWVGELGNREIKKNNDDIDSLRKEVAELKEMLKKSLEVN